MKTKNRKYGKTTLLEIPELLKIAQDWDDEVRSVLSPTGFWFALFSPETCLIDTNANSIGEYRISLARRNIKTWLEKVGLPYHAPHKFRHGHIQYAMARAESIADYKAISMNVMHASMEITDEFYSNLNDGEVQSRIASLGKQVVPGAQDELNLLKEFLDWQKSKVK